MIGPTEALPLSLSVIRSRGNKKLGCNSKVGAIVQTAANSLQRRVDPLRCERAARASVAGDGIDHPQEAAISVWFGQNLYGDLREPCTAHNAMQLAADLGRTPGPAGGPHELSPFGCR